MQIPNCAKKTRLHISSSYQGTENAGCVFVFVFVFVFVVVLFCFVFFLPRVYFLHTCFGSGLISHHNDIKFLQA